MLQVSYSLPNPAFL